MDKLKQWVALTLVAALGIAAAGWFLLISPKRADATKLASQTAEQEKSNDALRTQIKVLQAQAKELPAAQAKLESVATKIPPTPATPALLRALASAADASGVELLSVTPGIPTPPVATAAVAAAPATATTPPAYLVETVAINVFGSYAQIQTFMSALETLPRSTRTTALALVPGANPLAVGTTTTPTSSSGTTANGKTLAATISAQIYVSGASTTAAPGATAPSAAATQTTTTPASATAATPAS